MKMKVITYNDIKNLDISPIKCYEWVEEMLMHKNDAILPPKISLHLENDAFFNVMPCLFPHNDAGGVKVITRHLDRVPALDSQIMLYDYKTGEPKAIMDGNWITAMRTGAVAAHTIKTLAVKNFYEIGVMGLGNTGRAAMKVLLALYPDRPLKIKVLKYKDQHTEYVEYFRGADGKNYPNAEFVFVDSYEDVIRNSDVIISAITYTDDDFCPDECYKPGCLVTAVHLRGFLNCDLSFDKVFCDDEGHVNKFKYFDKWKYHAEVADVITNKAKGRESDEEKIIAYNVGLSMHDINYAAKIYDMAVGCGQEITLEPPKEKFWI